MHSVITSKIPDDYSLTYTTRLDDMLNLAQAAYGLRDDSYIIQGIDFVENNSPQIWYPGSYKHIAIKLTPDTITDQIQGCYQLAHECIHLLSPSGGYRTNILEEGLATYFAHQYVKKEFNCSMSAAIQSYETARQLVHKLLEFDADAVKKIRKSQFAISEITSENILEVVPQFNPADAQVLEREFVRSL